MKRLFALFLLHLVLIVHAKAILAEVDERTHLRIGIYERPLFRERDDQGFWHGLDIDIVKAVFERTPYTYEFIDLPWQRNLRLIQNGTIDIGLSAAPLEERKAYAYFSEAPFRLGHNALYVNREKMAFFEGIHHLADIKDTDIRLGIMRGVSYSDEFEKLAEEDWFKQHLITIDDRDRLPEMLMLDRIDAYLDSAYDGQRRLQLDPKAKAHIKRFRLITTHDEAVTYMMFSKRSVPILTVDKINQALNEFVASGGYQRLLSDYHLEDVEHSQ